jgi:hypothetical protein
MNTALVTSLSSSSSLSSPSSHVDPGVVRRSGSWRRRLSGLVLIATGLLSVAGADTASAVGASNVTGRPGAVSVYAPQVKATDFPTTIYYSINGVLTPLPVYKRAFSTSGAIVGRSPASGASQTVVAMYSLQKWSGTAWVSVVNSGKYYATLSGTITQARFPAWSVAPTAQSGGTYRVVYLVTWFNTSTAGLLASELVFPNRAGETACATARLRCTPYTDSVVVG